MKLQLDLYHTWLAFWKCLSYSLFAHTGTQCHPSNLESRPCSEIGKVKFKAIANVVYERAFFVLTNGKFALD